MLSQILNSEVNDSILTSTELLNSSQRLTATFCMIRTFSLKMLYFAGVWIAGATVQDGWKLMVSFSHCTISKETIEDRHYQFWR